MAAHMSVIKSDMLMPLALQRPLPLHRIASSLPSSVATNLRIHGRRFVRLPRISSLGSVRLPSHSYISAGKTLADSFNNDDHDFVDSLSSWNCIGSSHGWLGYVNPTNLSFYLFKPSLINDQNYLPFISLPPLQFLSDNPNAISKMVFSSSPSPMHRHIIVDDNNNSSVLVVITLDWFGPAAAFCRMGDLEWTTLANFPVESACSKKIFQDITYYSRLKLFYVITNSGEIYSWDLYNYHYCPMMQQDDCKFQYLIKPPKTSKLFPRKLGCDEREIVNCKYYLVMNESSGELMMIRLQIYYAGPSTIYKSGISEKLYKYDVHSLDIDRRKLKWFRVNALVNTALFVGRNNGSVVDVRKAPGLMIPGYIYLACNADNVFQLTGLCVFEGDLVEPTWDIRNFFILRAEMTPKGNVMTSFPVWNFE